jgi:hypothetical protein
MLKRTGREKEAKVMFRYFLHRIEAPRGQMEEMILGNWNYFPVAVSVARSEVEELSDHQRFRRI